MSPSLITTIFLLYILKILLGSWKATLAAGRGGLLKTCRRRLHLKRRRLGVRGPEARSGARKRGAASALGEPGLSSAASNSIGRFSVAPQAIPRSGQRPDAAAAATMDLDPWPETRHSRGSNDGPGSNSSATALKPSRLQWRLRHPAAALAPPPVTSRRAPPSGGGGRKPEQGRSGRAPGMGFARGGPRGESGPVWAESVVA